MMINFRKIKQDYSPTIVKEGKDLYDRGMVESAKIVSLTLDTVRLNCCVRGNYDNTYVSEVEISRSDSSVIDSDCDCPYSFDCQHLTAVLHHLEENFDSLVVQYSDENDIDQETNIDEQAREELKEAFEEAKTKQEERQEKQLEKELLDEYLIASEVLGGSPFFQPEEILEQDKAELLVIVSPETISFGNTLLYEAKIALRLPFRSKPLNVLNAKEFLDSVRYHEAVFIGNRRFFFGLRSFDQKSAQILKMIMDFGRFPDKPNENTLSHIHISSEALGSILAHAYEMISDNTLLYVSDDTPQDLKVLPCLYYGHAEEPMRSSGFAAKLRFEIENLITPASKILLNPSIMIDHGKQIQIEEANLFECSKPGLLFENVYYRFQSRIRRKHLRHLPSIRNMTIPEPLFGTFVEISLPELMRFAEVINYEVIEKFVTLPYVGSVSAVCDISYLDGELEASLWFQYDNNRIPAAPSQLSVEHFQPFVTSKGIVARNLTDEQDILQDLFQDFLYDPRTGIYSAKNEKRIVEFMTEVVPRNQHRVTFNYPENLLEKFIYDQTTFVLDLKENAQVDSYDVTLKINGHLNGFTVDHLWDCLASKRSFIELVKKKGTKRKGTSKGANHKFLVLDLEKIAPVVQFFDEIGIVKLEDHTETRPLWSLASITEDQFKELPIDVTMSPKLKEIQKQMLGQLPVDVDVIPTDVKASLRPYQKEGIEWLSKLRNMHLNGILADDMGLGKTIQAITALTQFKEKQHNAPSIVVCPTSLIYNWYEEFAKFNPKIKVLPIEGTPPQRKKLIAKLSHYDVVITSYSLLQKDIEQYCKISFGYAILDEAQHIKNRGTRNAKSVKMLSASHKLILTGTPIENSLDELWSLFDFLMPGLLSTYDRFVDKYVRSAYSGGQNMHALRKKVSPFILRRMKKDVLSDLPPVSEILYHSHMSDLQRDLYRSFATSAREELSQLVKKEGFDKVQIQVLATLTRLKQICCHPAIFAKEKPEPGDSAKYDMLMELLQTLMEGKHKTVIFSQYTRMLGILREDLQRQGVRFCYLDGSTKNRMSIVKEFNEDDSILVFLISLKAGGTGLNLTSADTVIHYDIWWNPAVEDQATDRLHRIGQKKSVSSYKLVTVGTIEEKIVELQNRKKGLVKKVINSDDEIMSKLTWEEVLELLQI
ncbi:MAG: DEAD/DEAH box helicase [Chlamydiales bacterium]